MKTTWKIDPAESRRVLLINDQQNHAIGEIIDTRNPDHARLIAAAPDLLQTLERMLSEHDCIQMANKETTDRWKCATTARKLINHIKGTP